MTEPTFIPLPDYPELSTAEMAQLAADFYAELRRRRAVRDLRRPVPRG
ncbi:MAG: hypothetical protein R2854_03930 [Caldilineaceae bacterium]